MRRLPYAVLSAVLLILAALCVTRLFGGSSSLPTVRQPDALQGRSCVEALAHARGLTAGREVELAREAYLWIIETCDRDETVLPQALLEAGSLLGHLAHRPDEAHIAYETFLGRFPNHPGAPDALFHLARLEIDAGDSADAIAHLTLLSQRFPDSAHKESATFLASRAADLVAADRRAQRTFLGQLARTVPTNLLSLIALLAAIGPSVIQTLQKASTEESAATHSRRWMVPGVIIGLTLLNYVINNIDSARQNAQLMSKIDQLLAAGVPEVSHR